VAGAERLSGILEELAGAGLEPASGRTCYSWHPPDGWAATTALLAAHPRPGALICFNDRLAFGAYQALQETGASIPEDVSLVSFDDNPLAGWLRPGLLCSCRAQNSDSTAAFTR
jgi:LacI family transcriptional regulator